MPTEGLAPFQYPLAGKPLQTWYQIYGDLSNGQRRPLIIVHGGPGVPCDYLMPLARGLWEKYAIPTVVYDQIGCGRSTHLRETKGNVEFWTAQGKGVTYMWEQQLGALIQHLGVGKDFDLLGFSFGGATAVKYCVGQGDDGLKHLIIASTPFSMKRWELELRDLLRQMGGNALETVVKHEAAGTVQDPEFLAVCEEFARQYQCRIPEELQPPEQKRAMELQAEDQTIYETLNGPLEFTILGPLTEWDATDIMNQVRVPTLVTNGAYDIVPSRMMKAWVDGIPDTKWVVFEESSHATHLEEPEKYLRTVDEFLK